MSGREFDQPARSVRGCPWRMLRFVVPTLASALLVSLVAPAAVPTEDRADLGKIDTQLVGELQAASADEQVEALVVLRAQPTLSPPTSNTDQVAAALEETAVASQAHVVTVVEDGGGEVRNTFWIKNMILVRARPDTLEALTALDAVDRIIPNFEVTLSPNPGADIPQRLAADNNLTATEGESTWGIERIGADAVHRDFGLTGDGVRVAVLDTGVDITHPDLAGKMATADPSDPSYPGGWMAFDPMGLPLHSTPHDSEAHGTHVAGTVAGGNVSGVQIGVAPGVELMAGLVIPGGQGTFAQIVAGMQWAVAPFDADGEPAGEPADIVNMSLGQTGYISEIIDVTRNIYLAGVFPSFAIGNNCPPGLSSSPGNVYEAVAVGATDQGDRVPAFSCGGVVERSDWTDPPEGWPESYVVPDVSAPGVEVRSAVPGGGYALSDGTSMATPHVSGTVALMLEGRPDLSVDQALQTLVDTAFFDDRHGAERPNSRFGWGRIDALEAVAEATLDSGVTGTVTDAKTGEPVPGAVVTRAADGKTRHADEEGRFRIRLLPGSYDLAISGFGYQPVTVEDVVVAEDAFTQVDRALTPLPVGRISGTVTYEPTGATVPGATVRVLDVPAELHARTAINGAYTIDNVPVGDYRVAASSSNLPSSEGVEVTVSANQTTRGIELSLARPWPTQRITVTEAGTLSDSASVALSADGRLVAFTSRAPDLVEADYDGYHVFVHDRDTGRTELVSVTPDGSPAPGNLASIEPSLSADGRHVAFASGAPGLVSGDANSAPDIFVRDRHTGTTEWISVSSGGTEANGHSRDPVISADGRYVAFESDASNLVDGDTNGEQPGMTGTDVFVHDRDTGETWRVSVASDGTEGNLLSWEPAISADGRYVAFTSLASNLVEGDTNDRGLFLGADVFVHDLQTGATERVSVASDGSQAGGSVPVSGRPHLSSDGRYAAFQSFAPNLVPDDENLTYDAFVHDRQTGTTERVSLASDGTEGNGVSWEPVLSADARYVAFSSFASNLAGPDGNGAEDVLIHDRQTGGTQRVSVAFDGTDPHGPRSSDSGRPALSADGRHVGFSSYAWNLVEGDTSWDGRDVFVRDTRPDEPEARFVPWDLKVRPSSVRPERPVVVMARVKNIGQIAGDYRAELRVNGEVVDTTTVTVEPDLWSWARFQVRLDAVGDYQVAIGPLTGELTVAYCSPPGCRQARA